MNHAPRPHEVERVVREGKLLGIGDENCPGDASETKLLTRERYPGLGQVARGQDGSGAGKRRGVHADPAADLEHIATPEVREVRERARVRLQ